MLSDVWEEVEKGTQYRHRPQRRYSWVVGRGLRPKSLKCKIGDAQNPKSRSLDKGGIVSWKRGHLNRH